MLVMRNTPGGCIWQAYTVENNQEVELLTATAEKNAFLVERKPAGYTRETFPGWREAREWKDYRDGTPTPRQALLDVLKGVRCEGPYWVGEGRIGWLANCFNLRNLKDLKGFKPISCWSGMKKKTEPHCFQYLVCTKNRRRYIDIRRGSDRVKGYGLKPKPLDKAIMAELGIGTKPS